MRRLAIYLVTLVGPLMAQSQEAAAQSSASSAASATPAVSPEPKTESWLTGSIDVGDTWRSDVGGSFNAYRSIVNLGSGPTLIGADFTILDLKHRLFDEIRVR